MSYNIVEIIIKKRDGGTLTAAEIKYAFNSYIDKKIPDYQMSSLLMAIYQKGMIPSEIAELARIYIESGKQIKFPPKNNTVDKHSTGGVGDKITIMLAPIVAACGAPIPMISGRGLGHTGGTLDKLESIPGLRTDYDEADFRKFIDQCGFSIISQSEELVPIDKMIYALRDVTGTVESLPLITASIMSKKIAEGAQNLVIDLKVGNGAFIKDIETADVLAELLQKTGASFNQKVSVIYTNMNSPLGHYCGNALEIKESIEFLKGNYAPDIYKITKALATEMLILAAKAKTIEEAGEMVDKVIEDGSALRTFRHFIDLQGGDPEVCEDLTRLPSAKFELPIIAAKDGWIREIDAQSVGYALVEIGAGRKTLTSKLDYSAGAHLPLKIGDKVNKGKELGYIFCNDESLGMGAVSKILEAYKISDQLIRKEEIVLKIVSTIK